MTQPATTRPGLLQEIRNITTSVAVAEPEPPAVVLRRRIVVAAVLVIGAVLLGYSLSREPGDNSFFWLTLVLAAVWAVGSLVSGPLHLGRLQFRGRNQRPVITGILVGVLVACAFLLGGLGARQIPGVAEYAVRVLEFTNQGAFPLVVLVTVLNGAAEELYFRGALYTALGKTHPAVISTLVYIAVILATGNPLLAFGAIVLGIVCVYERRITGGVLAPMLTHFFWGLIMVLALPAVFGL
jgi:membrane protease YdiL (CAAX protease family)